MFFYTCVSFSSRGGRGVSVKKGSLPKVVSVQGVSGGLCPGVSVWGSLSPSVWGSLSRGSLSGGLCQGVFVRGLSVQGDSLSKGVSDQVSLTETPSTVMCGRYASYLNALK